MMCTNRISPLALLAAAASAGLAQTPGFHLVEPPPGTINSVVFDITQDGVHGLGFASNQNGSLGIPMQVFNGVSTPISLPPGERTHILLSGDGTHTAGSVVDSGSGLIYPARRAGSGAAEPLTLQHPGRPTVINGDGSVVGGYAELPDSRLAAFRWTPSGDYTFLVEPNDPGIISSTVTGVSADGAQMCGRVINSSNFLEDAFLWTETRGFETLERPVGSTEAGALAMSSDGRLIAGMYGDSQGFAHEIMWTPDGIVELGRLIGTARAISNNGVLVLDSDSRTTAASVWTSDLGQVSLPSYLSSHGISVPDGWTLYRCRAISDDGLTFAGTAVLSDGITSRGFVATIPGSGSLIVLFMAFTFDRRKRR